MTPEQKADWDKTVDVARERNDHSLRRWHMVDAYSDAILAANETIATLTREREEAIARAQRVCAELGESRQYIAEQGRIRSKLESDVEHFRGVADVQKQRAGEWERHTIQFEERADRAEAQLAEARGDFDLVAEAIRSVCLVKDTDDAYESLLVDAVKQLAKERDEAQCALEIDRHALSAMQRDLDQSRGESERLRAALAPFAELAKEYDHPDWQNATGTIVRIGQLRAARAALNPPAEGQTKPTTE